MSRTMNCPKCDADISDTYESDDPSCGIIEGWYCDACDLGVAGWEHPREPLDDDVGIAPAGTADYAGTPPSQLSGRAVPPDHPDYPKFLAFQRIAKSWGFE